MTNDFTIDKPQDLHDLKCLLLKVQEYPGTTEEERRKAQEFVEKIDSMLLPSGFDQSCLKKLSELV